MPDHQCYLCGTEKKELRPYGPAGQNVCFPCATKPENEAETKRQYRNQIEAAEKASRTVIIGEETGPRPISKERIS